MSIFSKKKPAADSDADVALDREIGNAVATALAKGVFIHRVIELLERHEQAARSRLAATHGFGPRFVSGNLPD